MLKMNTEMALDGIALPLLAGSCYLVLSSTLRQRRPAMEQASPPMDDSSSEAGVSGSKEIITKLRPRMLLLASDESLPSSTSPYPPGATAGKTQHSRVSNLAGHRVERSDRFVRTYNYLQPQTSWYYLRVTNILLARIEPELHDELHNNIHHYHTGTVRPESRLEEAINELNALVLPSFLQDFTATILFELARSLVQRVCDARRPPRQPFVVFAQYLDAESDIVSEGRKSMMLQNHLIAALLCALSERTNARPQRAMQRGRAIIQSYPNDSTTLEYLASALRTRFEQELTGMIWMRNPAPPNRIVAEVTGHPDHSSPLDNLANPLLLNSSSEMTGTPTRQSRLSELHAPRHEATQITYRR
ncbi:hypothetical protein BU15DRAFT_61952 [Melanogaster broomeanus]|nr:hypothetical protein BU15DRAFT_61952 [Melanogaster broomeanus]